MTMRASVTVVMIVAGMALIVLAVAGDNWPPSVRLTVRLMVAASYFLFAWQTWRKWRRNV